jgi:hypothetical protein
MDTIHPERNPETMAAHRREVFRQITLPTLIGLIILFALVFLVIYASVSGNSEISRWADVSLIWLLLPSILFALLFLVILIGLTYGLTRLLHVLPFFAYRMQLFIFKIQTRIKSGSDSVVEPILKINSFMARARRLLRRR